MKRKPFKIERFGEGVGNMDTHFDAIRKFSDAPFGDRMDPNFWDGRWTEVNEEVHEYYLNVLPPTYWHDGMFAMSERQTDDVTGVLIQLRLPGTNKYRWFFCWCNMSQPQENMRIMRLAIEEQISVKAGMSVVTGKA